MTDFSYYTKVGESPKGKTVLIGMMEDGPVGQGFTLPSGKNALYTAMAQTVGLPIAFAVELILDNKIKSTGVLLPILKEIYEPVLEELKKFGVEFKEKNS